MDHLRGTPNAALRNCSKFFHGGAGNREEVFGADSYITAGAFWASAMRSGIGSGYSKTSPS